MSHADARAQAQTALTQALSTAQTESFGAGNYIEFGAGQTFQLAMTEVSDGLDVGPYLLTEVTHHAYDYSYLPEDMTSELASDMASEVASEQAPEALGVSGLGASGYSNRFKRINTKLTSYAPKRTLPKPFIPDVQSAFVTGPKGYDKDVYTNDRGDVQVQFPWDRSGDNTVFIPVCHSAAGSEFGLQFTPRIGQEVLIHYVGGDVDLPMVIGSVANGNTPPAYDLCDNPNLTWVKTNTVNSKDPQQGHHLVFDDTPNKEQLNFKSQKDYLEEVVNNSTYRIEGNDEIHIGGNELIQAFNQSMTLQGKTLTLSGGGSEVIISEYGIALKGSASSGGVVQLCSKGAGPLKPVARTGDKYACPKRTAGTPHHGGPLIASAKGITANHLTIARQGDQGYCRITTDHIKGGIATTLINGKPIARLNHAMKHGGVITTSSGNVFTGEKPPVPDVYQFLHIKPENILVIHLCDFYNESNPTAHQACMHTAIQSITAYATARLSDGSTRPWPGTPILSGKLYLPGQKPSDIKHLSIRFEPGSEFYGQEVNVIAINGNPIAPCSSVHLSATEFTQKPSYQDKGQNTCYPMSLTLLQPALFFNFRQDNWCGYLQGCNADTYNALGKYFDGFTPVSAHDSIPSAQKRAAQPRHQLTEDELNYFKHNGNNATLFIHGYNVPTGRFAKGFQWVDEHGWFSNDVQLETSFYDSSLYRDQTTLSPERLKAFKAYAPTLKDKVPALVGTGAHRWLVCMEHNLNKAAGFNAPDYRQYTRIIMINWQGNPGMPYDYMAAAWHVQIPSGKNHSPHSATA